MRKQTRDGVVLVAHSTASLWRRHETLGCYVLIWPEDEPALESILHTHAMVATTDGEMHGPYLYTNKGR